MEQVHGVLPQQLQAGHQCIPTYHQCIPTYTRGGRKRRTRIDKYHKFKLEEEFERNCRPSRAEIQEMVERFGNGLLDCETIRIWFSNRRMRHKRRKTNQDDEPEENPWPKLQRKEDVDNTEEPDEKESVREGVLI